MATTHTEAYDEQVRNAQRDELVTLLGDGPLVILGDFNAEPDAVGMPDGFLDAWQEVGGETCCQAADLRNEQSQLTQRIDYVWVRGVRVVRCKVVGVEREDLWPSDHAGVLAELVS